LNFAPRGFFAAATDVNGGEKPFSREREKVARSAG
jgi:hypothetical protein